MTKYEYKIIKPEKKGKLSLTYDPTLTETMLTGYGLQGWKLSHTLTRDGSTTYLVLVREV